MVSLKNYKKYISETRLIILLLFVAIFLRLIFFSGQVWLGSDVTRDISISREALLRRELPMTGSFSSAGPFVFGPTLYWIYMIGFIAFPSVFMVPWFIGFMAAVVSLAVFYILAKNLGKQIFFYSVIFLSAFSPQLILSSFSPTQHTFVLIFSLLSIFFLYRLHQKLSTVPALLAGISLGLAINMHYQALNLVFLPFIVLFYGSANLIKRAVLLSSVFLGIIFALLPLTLWDLGQAFANWRNLFDYLLIGQSRIYVANSWKLYVFDYLPKYFSYVTGIHGLVGLGLLIGGSALLVLDLINKRKLNFIFLLNCIFLLMIFVGRYYRGERFAGYTVYLIPFIILFFSWTIERGTGLIFFSKNSVLKKSFLFLFGFSILISAYFHLKGHAMGNTSLRDVEQVSGFLTSNFPNQKFRILNLAGTNPDASYALATYLEYQKLYDIDAPVKIGFCMGCKQSSYAPRNLIGTSYFVIDDDNDGSWQGVSQAEIYDSTIGWLNKRQLKTSFYPDRYLKNKLFGN